MNGRTFCLFHSLLLPVLRRAKTSFPLRQAFSAVLCSSFNKWMLSSSDKNRCYCSIHTNLFGSSHCFQARNCFLFLAKLNHSCSYTNWSGHIPSRHKPIQLELFKMDLWDFILEKPAVQLPCKVALLTTTIDQLSSWIHSHTRTRAERESIEEQIW